MNAIDLVDIFSKFLDGMNVNIDTVISIESKDSNMKITTESKDNIVTYNIKCNSIEVKSKDELLSL